MLRFSVGKTSFTSRGLTLVDVVPTKKRAKVLLFFDMAKYFGKKMKKKCIFVILSPHFDLLHGDE